MKSIRLLISVCLLATSFTVSAASLEECRELYRKNERLLNAELFGHNSTSAIEIGQQSRKISPDSISDYLQQKYEWLIPMGERNETQDPVLLKKYLSQFNLYGYDEKTNPTPRKALNDLAALVKSDPKAVREFIEADLKNDYQNYKNELVSNHRGNVIAMWMLASDGATFDEQLNFLLEFNEFFTGAYALKSLTIRNLSDSEKMRKIFVGIAKKMQPVSSQSSFWVAAAAALPEECKQ